MIKTCGMLLILGSAQGLQVFPTGDGRNDFATPSPTPSTPAPTAARCRSDADCSGYDTCERSGMVRICKRGYCPPDAIPSCSAASCNSGFTRGSCATTCHAVLDCKLQPTAAPTAAPTAPPTTTTTPGGPPGGPDDPKEKKEDGPQVTGDPHVQNIFGQRFDIMQPGRHVLLHIPRAASASATLLRVQADARHEGGQCADMYFKALNVTGAWVGTDGHTYSADAPQKSHGWMTAGKVEFKVAWGHTLNGIQYLNFYVRHLKLVDHEIGGLLGMDDFKEAATSNAWCKDVIQLRQGISDRNASFAVADM